MGASCVGVSTGGVLSLQEQSEKHQYFRNFGNEVSDIDFHKEKASKGNVSSNFIKKHDCTKSLAENGREGKGRGTREDFKRNLGISSTVGDHDYSRIFPNSLNVTPDSESKNVVESSQ